MVLNFQGRLSPVQRPSELAALERALRSFPVVAVVGTRQVGKTTLARQLVARRKARTSYFDLERPEDLARLDDPMLALEPQSGLVVLDEVQRRPELFPTLRVLADRKPLRARFLVLGSASPELLRQSSESLAGRILYHELGPLGLDEVGADKLRRLWLRGGFPRAFLARGERDSFEWREQFVRTFLERDLPQLGVGISAITLHRFWSMLAHYHGQILNSSELARSFGVSDMTVRRYIDVLSNTFMVRQLPPWHENFGKRLVKSPKIYFEDSGILHALLRIVDRPALEGHPKVGASWEGFALRAVERRLGARREESHFWAAHAGPELDLLVVRGRRRLGFEFKRTTAPKLTRSMQNALDTLRLDSLDVLHAGGKTFPLAPRVRAVALCNLLSDLAPL
jgi:uncharacterized protein